jgi:hypothetical protein
MHPRFLFAFIVLVVFAMGCVTQAARAQVALTADEIREAAILIETAVADNGVRAFSQRMDTRTFLDRAFTEREIPEEARRELRRTWSFTELLGDFDHQIESGGTYTFRDLVDHEGQTRARFRLVGADLSLNYHDVLFSREAWGAYRVDDFAPVSLGGDMSTIVGMIYEAALAVDDGTADDWHTFVGESVTGDAGRAWRHFYGAASRATAAGRTEELLMLHVLRLRFAASLGSDEVAETIAAFTEAFPDHPTLHLNLIDALEVVDDLDGIIEALDALGRLLGEDAYLNSLRALVMLRQGDVAQAQRFARASFDAEPELPGAVTADFVTSIYSEDYARAVHLLTHMEESFGYEISPTDIETDPDFAGLVASEAYRTWVEGRHAIED